jgi:hypothetical protein
MKFKYSQLFSFYKLGNYSNHFFLNIHDNDIIQMSLMSVIKNFKKLITLNVPN